jgi:hypothetical protein
MKRPLHGMMSAKTKAKKRAASSGAPINAQSARHVGRNNLGRLVHVVQAREHKAPVSDRAPEMRGFRPNFGIPESEKSLQ